MGASIGVSVLSREFPPAMSLFLPITAKVHLQGPLGLVKEGPSTAALHLPLNSNLS